MPKQRDIRRLAMQVLYQIDQTGETDAATILETLDDEFDKAQVREQAVALALEAWALHDQADATISHLAPKWPTLRQPPVDRAILRLAHFEMTAGRTPMKIAINEAVELAKQYGAEQSPSFVNGVLDKFAKNPPDISTPADPAQDATSTDIAVSGDAPPATAPAKPDAKAWLDDALDTPPPKP